MTRFRLGAYKLCSHPLISNSDLYMAFYRGGYTPAEISRLFGRGYSTVWQQILRAKSPEARRKHSEKLKRWHQKNPPKKRTKEQRHQEYIKYKVNKFLKEEALKGGSQLPERPKAVPPRPGEDHY